MFVYENHKTHYIHMKHPVLYAFRPNFLLLLLLLLLLSSFHIYTTLPFAFNQNICRFFNTLTHTHTTFSMWYFVFVQLFRIAHSVHALVSHVYLCEMFAFECFIFIAIIYCEPYSRTKTWYWVCFSFQFQLNSNT